MRNYADVPFYIGRYSRTGAPKIPDAEFDFYAMQASGEIRYKTFERIDELTEIPEEVSMCCCEVAEKLYALEVAKGENGMILQNYGNDGETGTYRTSDLSESAVQRSIARIIRKWLAHTGYMYCGVE